MKSDFLVMEIQVHWVMGIKAVNKEMVEINEQINFFFSCHI